jgi:hypothetical protein
MADPDARLDLAWPLMPPAGAWAVVASCTIGRDSSGGCQHRAPEDDPPQRLLDGATGEGFFSTWNAFDDANGVDN